MTQQEFVDALAAEFQKALQEHREARAAEQEYRGRVSAVCETLKAMAHLLARHGVSVQLPWQPIPEVPLASSGGRAT